MRLVIAGSDPIGIGIGLVVFYLSHRMLDLILRIMSVKNMQGV